MKFDHNNVIFHKDDFIDALAMHFLLLRLDGPERSFPFLYWFFCRLSGAEKSTDVRSKGWRWTAEQDGQPGKDDHWGDVVVCGDRSGDLGSVGDDHSGNSLLIFLLLLMMITDEKLYYRWKSWVEATVVPMVLEVEGRSRSTSGETNSPFLFELFALKPLKLHPGVVTRTRDTQRQSCQTLEAAWSHCPALGGFSFLKWILSKLRENIIIQIGKTFLQGPTIWQKEQKQRGCRQYRGGTGWFYHFSS